MAVASHELKNPLTSLKLQIKLLAKILAAQGASGENRSSEIQRLILSSDQQIKKLVWLIDDMLEVSRISAGKLTLKPTQVDLGAIVKEVCERFAPELAVTKSELRLNLQEGVVGYWDAMRIEQVVTNLLTNAMKYGSGNLIEVSVWNEGHKALLRVQDYGIGITPADQKRIFQRFERAVTAKKYGGLGLGLFISREIVEAHVGKIWVESEPGKGSKFTVELPLVSEMRAAG